MHGPSPWFGGTSPSTATLRRRPARRAAAPAVDVAAPGPRRAVVVVGAPGRSPATRPTARHRRPGRVVAVHAADCGRSCWPAGAWSGSCTPVGGAGRRRGRGRRRRHARRSAPPVRALGPASVPSATSSAAGARPLAASATGVRADDRLGDAGPRPARRRARPGRGRASSGRSRGRLHRVRPALVLHRARGESRSAATVGLAGRGVSAARPSRPPRARPGPHRAAPGATPSRPARRRHQGLRPPRSPGRRGRRARRPGRELRPGAGGQGAPEARRRACRWHFLGRLQRNKVRLVAPVVHSGRASTGDAAAEIARRAPGAPCWSRSTLRRRAEGRVPPRRVPGGHDRLGSSGWRSRADGRRPAGDRRGPRRRSAPCASWPTASACASARWA